MAYTNLSADNVKDLAAALNTQFMGLDHMALMNFADALVGILGGNDDAALSALEDAVEALEDDLAALDGRVTDLENAPE